MLSLYCHRSSVLHRLGPGLKLSILLLLSATLFAMKSPVILLCACAFIASFYFVAKIPLSTILKQLRSLTAVVTIIFMVQVVIADWMTAVAIVLRFVTLLLAASLLTLTTRLSDMVAKLEKLLRPFARWIAVDKISLAFSLTLRLIPSLMLLTKQVKEAQRARGMRATFFSITFPVAIKALIMGNQIAEAVEARSFRPR
ncbi:MAG: energy-coupling factor transporter transmembrane protein EcfT [Chlamydiota bacterium]